MAAPRLTEEEVHEACAEIAAQGERPTVLTVYDRLGRGSLTTISKYFNSWKTSDEAQAFKAEELPAIVKLPEELTKEGEDLLKRMWNIAKGLADTDLEIQREALRQAELANQKKVEEAFAFSEAQSLKIERLEEDFNTIRKQFEAEHRSHKETSGQLADAEKTNVGILKDNDRLQDEVNKLRKQVTELEEVNKASIQEKQELQKSHESAIKQKDAEIRSLDMQVHKLQSSLDSTVKANDQLKTDIKGKTAELSNRTVELEKLSVRYEAAITDLNTAKSDLKAANKAASEAEKRVSKLEGQLEVYVSLGKKAKQEKSD